MQAVERKGPRDGTHLEHALHTRIRASNVVLALEALGLFHESCEALHGTKHILIGPWMLELLAQRK